jgi:DnaK suppressor protein
MKMNKNKLDQFTQLFLQRQKDIVDANLNRADEIDNGGDDVDIVQGALLKSIMDKLSTRDKEALNEIKGALKRLSEGTFGLCEDCDERIPEKRLNVLPATRLCVHCAELQEYESKQYRS